MRTSFIIDGFNLYHSVRKAERDFGEPRRSTKWLDLRTLCSSYLPLLGRAAKLSDIYYFSALAHHLEASKPDVTTRHKAYLECLRDSGVMVELSRFKPKDIRCPLCSHDFRRHEEKETDVAVAAKLLELFFADACDIAVLVTGDTDVAPAVRLAQRFFPSKFVWFAFPYARKSKELAQMANSFQMSKDQYAKHQLPNPYALVTGLVIAKPDSW